MRDGLQPAAPQQLTGWRAEVLIHLFSGGFHTFKKLVGVLFGPLQALLSCSADSPCH
jgi:hypothetical protein